MTRKTAPKAKSLTVKISTILELPGALFYGDAIDDPDMLDSAVRFQAIRTDFEDTGCMTTLQLALQREGFGRDEIASCSYGWPSAAAYVG
jgi:hypothetical protein